MSRLLGRQKGAVKLTARRLLNLTVPSHGRTWSTRGSANDATGPSARAASVRSALAGTWTTTSNHGLHSTPYHELQIWCGVHPAAERGDLPDPLAFLLAIEPLLDGCAVVAERPYAVGLVTYPHRGAVQRQERGGVVRDPWTVVVAGGRHDGAELAGAPDARRSTRRRRRGTARSWVRWG